MKKILVILLALLLPVVFIGCNKGGESSGGVIMSENEITVELYDQYTLHANAENSSYAEFTWSSSDDDIVSVENGVVTAKQIGTATVTASSEGASGSCEVTVIKNTNVPVLSLRSELELAEDSEFTLRPVLRFKGAEVDGVQYQWESSNPSVATVENGRVHAVQAGTAAVTATAQAYGETLSATVQVTVKNDMVLLLQDESVTLYKPGTSGTPVSYEASYEVVSSGNTPSGEVEWSTDDASVATVDQDGLVSAVGKGNTFVRVRGTFDGVELEAAMLVNVTVPVVERDDVLFDFDSKTGDVSELDTAIGLASGETIEKISERTAQGLVEYDYFAGSETLVKSGSWEVGEKLWRVETSMAAYDINTVVATRVLRTKDDILGMKRYNAVVMTEPEYYVLANDIDMEYADCPSLFVNGDAAGTMAWYGTFDGRGHKIINASFLTAWVATAGFFGSIGENSVVRDLAFVDCATDGAYGVFASFIFGTVENIYMDFNVVKIGGTARTTGLMALDAKSTAVIRNVVINYGEFSLWNGRSQCAFINNVATGATISDCYVVYFHATDPSLEEMFMTVAAQAQIDYESVMTLRSVSEFRSVYSADWDADIWELPSSDGVLPTFKD